MKRALIWGSEKEFGQSLHTIQYYELLGDIEVVAVTSEDFFYKEICGYKFIKKEEIQPDEFDIVIIMSENKMLSVTEKELSLRGFNSIDIIPFRAMCIPGFTIEKYQNLKENPPTIISSNCWGGLTYNRLGLQFSSPFINMFIDHKEFIKFLANPKHYFRQELAFERTVTIEALKASYPIVRCDDILFYCNHYKTYDEFVESWNRRKDRINWNNLFVMLFEEEPDIANEFSMLPYEKKVCFTSFPTNQDSLHFVEIKNNNYKFWQIINGLADGRFLYYDVFDLLIKGEVNLISKFI